MADFDLPPGSPRENSPNPAPASSLPPPDPVLLSASPSEPGADSSAGSASFDSPALDAPLGAPPPLPPLLAPTPPLLSAPPPPLPVDVRPLRGLVLAVIATAVVLLSLSVPAVNGLYSDKPTSYRIGAYLGTVLFWPLVVLPLFAIGRRFRTLRNQLIILLVVWGISIIGCLGNLQRARQKRAPAETAEAAPPAFPLPADSAPARDPVSEATSAQTEQREAANTALAQSYDFSSGSDARLVRTIEGAAEDRYHSVVAAYRAACALRPNDARLAVERARFIAHFADAEDVKIESVSADHAAAEEYLKESFPRAPTTAVYFLERSYGEQFDRWVATYAGDADDWPDAEAARFYLLRAERLDATAQAAVVRPFAEKSFRRQPSAEAAIVLAKALHALHRDEEASEVLASPAFAAASEWTRKQRMDLWFDLGRTREAFAEYTALRSARPNLVQDQETGFRLARAGHVAAGRELLRSMSGQFGRSPWFLRRQFEFEREFGHQSESIAAYRAWRATGWSSDPLFRQRFSLLQRFPLAPWNLSDVGGALLLTLTVVLCGITPFLLLGPIHYWSLWRRQRGTGTNANPWSVTPWGLRASFGVMAVAFVTEFLATWYFRPGEIQSWFTARTAARSVAAEPLMPALATTWVVVGLAALGMVWRSRAWHLFRSGRWTLGRAFAVAGLCVLGARIGAGLYLALFPSAKNGLTQISAEQLTVFKTLYAHLGAFGLVGVVGLFVPVFEETLLRGVVLGAFARHIPWIAANALQAAAFAALHGDLALSPFYFAFGYAAGELVRRSHSLLPSIIMHAGNNLIASLGLLFLNSRNGLLH